MTTKIIPQPPKPKATVKPTTINHLGYMVLWTGKTCLPYQDMIQHAVDSGLPQEIVDGISQHTVAASLGLAKNDPRWRKVSHNGFNVEVKQISKSAKSTTMEFLGYEVEDDGKTKKGKRTHFDKVAIDDKGTWLHSGTTKVAQSYREIVEDHLANLRGQDVYEKVTSPMLKLMGRSSIARNCYFVPSSEENEILIDSLDKFFSAIGYELICLTQANDKRTKDGIVSRAMSGLNATMTKIADKVGEWKNQNRVHGRSSKKVFEELAEILTETEAIEDTLQVTLQELKDQISQVKAEANVIIGSQAPTGVNDLAYDDFKKLVNDSSKHLDQTVHGPIVMLKVSEIENYLTKDGASLRRSATAACKSLGFYTFIKDDLVLLRPIAELTAMAS